MFSLNALGTVTDEGNLGKVAEIKNRAPPKHARRSHLVSEQ